MTGIFDVLAADDFEERRANRKAVAVAYRRSTLRFASFLESAKDRADFNARLALVDDDVQAVVNEVAEEHEAQAEPVLATVRQQLEAKGAFCDDCHKWKSGPKAGTCECGDGEASDGASVEASFRNVAGAPATSEVMPEPSRWDPAYNEWPRGQSPNSVPMQGEAIGPDGQVIPAYGKDQFWDLAKQHYQQHEDAGHTPGFSTSVPAGEGLTYDHSNVGPSLKDQFGQSHGGGDGYGGADRDELYDKYQELLRNPPMHPGQGQLFASTDDFATRLAAYTLKVAEDNLGGKGTPVPKMDKRKWKPNVLNDKGNLKPIDTEEAGSRNPTERGDIYDTPDYKDQERSFGNVLEHNAPIDKAYTAPQQHTDTFGNSYKQADPVTSVTASSPIFAPPAGMLHEGQCPSCGWSMSEQGRCNNPNCPSAHGAVCPTCRRPFQQQQGLQLAAGTADLCKCANPSYDVGRFTVQTGPGEEEALRAAQDAMRQYPGQQPAPAPHDYDAEQAQPYGDPEAPNPANGACEHCGGGKNAYGECANGTMPPDSRLVGQPGPCPGAREEYRVRSGMPIRTDHLGATLDVEKNPLAELVDYDGFVPHNEVTAAISKHDRK